MKKIFLYLLVFASLASKAQVGIGVAATDVAPSAQLEIKSSTKGLIISRMTEAQKAAIGTPAAGLLVYQTDGTKVIPFRVLLKKFDNKSYFKIRESYSPKKKENGIEVFEVNTISVYLVLYIFKPTILFYAQVATPP